MLVCSQHTRMLHIISIACKQKFLSVADYDFDEYDKPGAERSRRRRGEDDDLER